MEVKIDADELCELRRMAKDSGERSKIHGGFNAWQCWVDLVEAHRQLRELKKERDALISRIELLLSNADKSGNNFIKLQKERDWWRCHALWCADACGRTDPVVSDGCYIAVIKDAARSHGYEVPE